MTSDDAKQLLLVLREIRTCFNQLRALADRLHEDLGINSSMRAILESLVGRPGRTVPDIAREKGVSRQHVQVIMNTLLEAGLAEARDNPAHRRSQLFVSTAKADAAFSEIRAREAEPLARLAAGLPEGEVETTRAVLSRLNARLEAEIARTEP
jgi:DNA-binding MarR family transcriptional regulator